VSERVSERASECTLVLLGVAREDAADEASDGGRLKIIRLVSAQGY
jgi:hypothetical protein